MLKKKPAMSVGVSTAKMTSLQDIGKNAAKLAQQAKLCPMPKRRYACLRGMRIGVEGPIGMGKSHLLKLVNGKLEEEGEASTVLYEHPNQQMRGVFYGDVPKEAFSFQQHMLGKRHMINMESLILAGQHPKYHADNIYCVWNDRTMYGDLVFASMMYAAGLWTIQQWDAYWSVFCEMAPYAYSLIVLLDAPPEDAHYRVTELRKNPSEIDMKLDYLQGLRRAYYIHFREQTLSERVALVYIFNKPFCEPEQVLDLVMRAPTPKETAQLWANSPVIASDATPDQVATAFAHIRTEYDKFFEKRQQ
jgi:deoxyadenosine/deoxycytidine kinase